MTHSETQLLIGADPRAATSPELAAHLAGCAECAQFQREMLALDGNIRRALELSHLGTSADASAGTTVPPAVAAPTPITEARAARRRRFDSARSGGWAIAASVAIIFTLAVWALRPSDTLAHEVVVHLGYEPESWSSTQPVPPATVNEVLSKAGVALDMSSDKIVYARTCFVHGHLVPHLVVKTTNGPVTVIVIPNEKVKARASFHENGMTGVITPTTHGSLAVLAQGDTNVDAVAAQVEQSVRWLP